MTAKFRVLNVFLAISMALSLVFTTSQPALANSTAQTLPFSQNWSNTSLITLNDDWSSVPGVIGYIGDYLPTTSPTGIDPQTILDDITTTVDVIANNTNPSGSTSGGVIEAEIGDPVIALQGSGTADAPYILINLDTIAKSNIQVVYNVRDIDGATDNAIQPVALHYRIGSSGSWTNVASAFIADATTGPSVATLVTPVSVTLPSNANNQSLVQIRVITSNAVGSDEWVGIDDISITGSVADAAPTVTGTSPSDTATNVSLDTNIDITFSEAVSAPDGAYTIVCSSSGSHTFTGSTLDNLTFTLDPADNFSLGETCTVTVLATSVSDSDTNDPPDNMAADHIFTFTTLFDPAPAVLNTTPPSGASNVAESTNIDITFTEPVDVSGTWFDITCTGSGNHAAVVTGGSTAFTLDPDVDFSGGETCTVTVYAAQVTDQDTADPYDTMTSDYAWSFDTALAESGALAYVQANTTLTGDLDALTATFPVSIPQVLVDLPYQINSRMTLADDLPVGTTVTITVTTEDGGPYPYVTDALIPGNPFWVTELFDPDHLPADFDAGYGGHWEIYNITVSGPGTNAFDIDTTLTVESIISKDGFSSEVLLASLSGIPVHIDADEDAALAYVQANTTITGATLAELTATFPTTIPPVLVDLPYQINSRMTLSEDLPVGTTVTITVTTEDGGPYPYVTDALIPGNPFWITELFDPDATPADFNADYGGHFEIYNITVTSGGGDPLTIDTTVTIESIISKDGFTTPIVLDSTSLPVFEDADLAYVQANTTLTGDLDALTATFPVSIPQVLVDLPYQINSRMTLADALPAGTTVTITVTTEDGGPVSYVTDALIPGNPFWITELFDPDATPADFDADYGGHFEIYNITIDSGGQAVNTTVLIESIISKDGFTTPVVLDSISLPIVIDMAPTVSAVTPVNGATGVAVTTDLTVTFSEPVDVAAGWYAISCARSGLHTAAMTGGPTVFTLNPDVDLDPLEVCTDALENTQVTDQDVLEPPDQMVADYSWSFTTLHNPDTILPIAVVRAQTPPFTATIQGNAIVLPGTYYAKSFAIQDSTGGLYIYPASGFALPTMALGDVIKVKGTTKNYSNLLEFDPVITVERIGPGTIPVPLVTPTGSVAATQGQLIQVQGVITSYTEPPYPMTANWSFRINDGSGEVTIYVYRMSGLDMRGFEVGQQIRIIGLSGRYSTTIQVHPRYQTDVMDLRAAEVTTTDPLPDVTGVNPHRPVSATFNKDMDADTFAGNFAIAGITGTVSYDEPTRTASFTPDTALAGNTLYTATLNTSITDSYGVPLAAEYSWSFTTGEQDLIPPTITDRVPAPSATDVMATTDVIVTFSEELGAGSLNLAHFILTDPTDTVVPAAFSYDPVTFEVTLKPDDKLTYSTTYTMTVTGDTTDYAGNPLGADDVWTFTVMDEPPMQVFFGDLHNHTSISDGSGTPAQALAAGEAAGFDFMAISDHSYAIDDGEWATTLSAVEAATDSDFVALRGFEYTQGAEGHINVWNSTRHAVRTNTGCSYCDYTPNLESGSTVIGFYEWLASASNVGLDESGTLMQFNHPGWINFNDWFFHPEVSEWARLEEVGNGNGASYVFSEAEFIRSLDYGWKVGATNNADTHTTEWGTNTDNRTGVLMTELTKANLLEAMRLRRTYATEDKNFSLTMKANDEWMGSEIPNIGSIEFDITAQDPDGELAALVEIISDQGQVVAYQTPFSANYSWEEVLTITPGVHYYYVKVTQMDGDRIVSSPIWTTGTEDISVTDLTIQPTIPTIHSPSLLTVRVTNRVATDRTISVQLKINDVDEGAPIELMVPAYGDNYANFTWQPTVTGPVTVSAEMLGAPVGDNPDDNTLEMILDVTDEFLPLILIDASHGNINAEGNDMKPFINDLSAHGFNVLKNLDALTAGDLDNNVVKLLIITAPVTAYTGDELTAIGNFINAGGSLWMLGISDYTSSGANMWMTTNALRENAILEAIETSTGQQINMRMNDDEVVDGNTNNGYPFGVIWQDFPSADFTGIGVNVESVATWSLNSIIDRAGGALTVDDPGVTILMQGDYDLGCTTSGYYTNPNHTANIDAENDGDGFIYNPGWTCGMTTVPADAVPLPAAAAVQLTSGAGRIVLYGDSNDPFTIFAYTAGDGKQNELFNLQTVMWLLGEPLEKSTIAEARAQTTPDQPDNLDKVVWIEGEITAAYGEFFNVLYVQDSTGGITVHAPAGDIDAGTLARGTHVRVVGTIGIYNGDTEIEFFEAEMVQVITPDAYDATPLALTTGQAALESNQGWLTTVTGRVISKSGTDTLIVDDGSGPVRIFLDGYNGTMADIQLYDLVQVTGLASEDGEGARIRVRNHNFHPGVDDDVIILGNGYRFVFPIIARP